MCNPQILTKYGVFCLMSLWIVINNRCHCVDGWMNKLTNGQMGWVNDWMKYYRPMFGQTDKHI